MSSRYERAVREAITNRLHIYVKNLPGVQRNLPLFQGPDGSLDAEEVVHHMDNFTSLGDALFWAAVERTSENISEVLERELSSLLQEALSTSRTESEDDCA